MPVDFTDGHRHQQQNQVIRFSERNYELLKSGKRTTIRLGFRTYKLGRTAFTADSSLQDEIFDMAENKTHYVFFDSLYGDIVDVRLVFFSSLTKRDAIADGFDSLEALKAELEHIYHCSIDDETIVTVVKFVLDGDKDNQATNNAISKAISDANQKKEDFLLNAILDKMKMTGEFPCKEYITETCKLYDSIAKIKKSTESGGYFIHADSFHVTSPITEIKTEPGRNDPAPADFERRLQEVEKELAIHKEIFKSLEQYFSGVRMV